MNIGERNELIIKLKLIDLRDTQTPINIGNNINIIKSVGFNDEYKKLDGTFDVKTVSKLSDEKLYSLATISGINKSPGRSKADVFINGAGVSLKSMESAPPAIVNHTPRNGFEVACMHSKSKITDLDELINIYWDLRTKGIIKEDIANRNAESPFKSHKDLLKPILNYFLFDGSGQGMSNHQASLILDYKNPLQIETWHTYNKDNAVDLIWDRLIFSVRSKGMPEKFPDLEKERFESVKIWTQYFQNKYRGSLHIRTK